uniref:G-protein coupled receptors family 2 profile 1 domain-containing protein n=1 Tax=Astyanax mexicanus TaxID=7994 RepID=A0A3B1J9T4_ASTMX
NNSAHLYSHCSRFWDGWLCWDETPAGTYASQSCPDFPTFDTSGEAHKAINTLTIWISSQYQSS